MGADIEERDRFNMTPLLYALYIGRLEIVKLLIWKGADMYARDIDGWTVILCALSRERPYVVEYLLENGGREFVNARDNKGDTVVCWLVRRRDLSGIEKVVEAGALLNLTNSMGETPFQFARRMGAWHNEIASFLWSQLSPDEEKLQGPRFNSGGNSADDSN